MALDLQLFVPLNRYQEISYVNAAHQRTDSKQSTSSIDGNYLNALRRNDLDYIMQHVNSTNVNQTTEDGIGAVHIAVKRNSSNAVKRLIDLDADFYKPTIFYQNAIELAVYFSDEKIWNLLLDKNIIGANDQFLTRNKGGLSFQNSLLNFASESGNTGAVRALIKAGADPYYRNGLGFNALDSASLSGAVDILDYLLDSVYDQAKLRGIFNFQHKIGTEKFPTIQLPFFAKQHFGKFYPLSRGFSQINTAAVIEKLIEAGADPLMTNSLGQTTKEVALDKNLLDHVSLFEFDRPNMDSLVEAINNHDCNRFKVLVSLGAPINSRFDDSSNLLHTICRMHKPSKKQIEALDFLLEETDLNPNQRTNSSSLQRAPLHLAILAHNRAAISSLISRVSDVDINIRDRFGYTPLHYAVQERDIITVIDLLRAGANPTLAAKPQTPLQISAALKDSSLGYRVQDSILDYLWRAQKSDEISTRFLSTDLPESISGAIKETGSMDDFSLFESIANNEADKIPSLLEAGKDPNIKFYSSSYSPLHYAARKRDAKAIKALLDDKRTNPNFVTDRFNFTPLHIAVLRNDLECVRALMSSNKTNPDIPDLIGATPLHYAVKNANKDIIEVLTKGGAKTRVMTKEYDPLEFAVFLGGRRYIKKLLINPNLVLAA